MVSGLLTLLVAAAGLLAEGFGLLQPIAQQLLQLLTRPGVTVDYSPCNCTCVQDEPTAITSTALPAPVGIGRSLVQYLGGMMVPYTYSAGKG